MTLVFACGSAPAQFEPVGSALLLDAELAFDGPERAPKLRERLGQAVEGRLFRADAAAGIRRHAVLPDGSAAEVVVLAGALDAASRGAEPALTIPTSSSMAR